jgi:hypothetical protein
MKDIIRTLAGEDLECFWELNRAAIDEMREDYPYEVQAVSAAYAARHAEDQK